MWAPDAGTRSWKARWPLARFLLPRRRLEERRKLGLKVIVRIHAASPYLVILAAVKASKERCAPSHEIGGLRADGQIRLISLSEAMCRGESRIPARPVARERGVRAKL